MLHILKEGESISIAASWDNRSWNKFFYTAPEFQVFAKI